MCDLTVAGNMRITTICDGVNALYNGIHPNHYGVGCMYNVRILITQGYN